MKNTEFAEKLQEIADGIDKLAAQAEKAEAAGQSEKTAAAAAEFGIGELGSKPSKGSNPLLDFCLS